MDHYYTRPERGARSGDEISVPLRADEDIVRNFVYETIEMLYPLNFADFLRGADVRDTQTN